MSFEKLHIMFFRDLVEERLSQKGLSNYYRTQMNNLKESIDCELGKSLSPADREKILREVLESIAKTDISEKAPDHLWLNKWRNDTKEKASQALKQIEGMK